MEMLLLTMLVKIVPTFFCANKQQCQISANPSTPTPRTPIRQPRLTGSNPKWEQQNLHLLNGKLYSSHIPCEQYCHYKCDHCELYGHLWYNCPTYKCPICQESCSKKPKNCPRIIPPLVTEVHITNVPPPYVPSQWQDGRQTPFHGDILNNPMPIANCVQGHTPLCNCPCGQGMPNCLYQCIAPRPLAPVIMDCRGPQPPDVPCIHIDHCCQPFHVDIPYPHHHQELVPILEPYEIPTSRTPNQVVNHISFPAADMSVTDNPHPVTVGFTSCDAYVDAHIDAGDYGTLFEWWKMTQVCYTPSKGIMLQLFLLFFVICSFYVLWCSIYCHITSSLCLTSYYAILASYHAICLWTMLT